MSESTSETPVLDLLASMTTDSIEASSLDAETLALVRIAALVAVDAPAVSYLMNLAIAGEMGVDAEQVRGVLAAVAPIVGTARDRIRDGQDRQRARGRDRGRGNGRGGRPVTAPEREPPAVGAAPVAVQVVDPRMVPLKPSQRAVSA